MFGWGKKTSSQKPSAQKSEGIIFDLTPLLAQTPDTQKQHLNFFADRIFSEAHVGASRARGYQPVLEGWIFHGSGFMSEPELIYGSTLQMKLSDFQPYSGDPNDHESIEYRRGYQAFVMRKWNTDYKAFFQISKLQSVYKLAAIGMPSYRRLNLEREGEDLKILNLIALEASAHILLGKKDDPTVL